jgi:glutaredoxin 3
MTGKIEVFSAGCPLCEPVVELVQRVAGADQEVLVHNLNEAEGARRAREAHVQRVPMVLVDGKPADCCAVGPVTEAGLRAAGVGAG